MRTEKNTSHTHTYASSALEFASDTHVINLQRLQNKLLRTIGIFPRRTPVRDSHLAFKLPYVYDYITKLCRKKQKSYKTVILNIFATLDEAKPETENVRGLNLAAVKHTTVQVTRLPL
jgi:hypothetical protein